jgi:phage shock protein PspC (stress-responsive transcriptional regulator)
MEYKVKKSSDPIKYLYLFNFFITKFPWQIFLIKVLKTVIATAVMIAICQSVMNYFDHDTSLIGWLSALFVAGTLGIAGYLLTSSILKHPDMSSFTARMKSLIISFR